MFVGDESSVALACALRTVTSSVSHVFEAADPAALTTLLATLKLDENAVVVGKSDDRAALLASARDAAGDGPFDLVVTGDAKTVHSVRRDARGWANPPRQVKGKAYWAEGRTGLD